MSNHPFHEVVAGAQKLIADGGVVFQKFTCAGCGKRLTMEEPDTFFVEGTCDTCDHITNIEKDGCNFLLVMRRTG